MTYHEKRNLVTSVIGLLVLVSYLIYAILTYNEGSVESLSLRFWAIAMLIFIGIGIGSIILAMILFHIVYSIGLAIRLKREDTSITDEEINKKINQLLKTDIVEDEMGKLIELKSMRISSIFVGVGFVVSLLSLILDFSPVIMLNILFISFGLGSAFEGLLQIHYYKKGVHHA